MPKLRTSSQNFRILKYTENHTLSPFVHITAGDIIGLDDFIAVGAPLLYIFAAIDHEGYAAAYSREYE